MFREKCSQNNTKSLLCGEPFGSLFATFFEHRFFNTFWSPFGFTLAAFWHPLAPFWPHLTPFWLPLGLRWLPFGSILTPRDPSGIIFGVFWRICMKFLLKLIPFCLNAGSSSYSGDFVFQNPSFEHPTCKKSRIAACAPTTCKFSHKPFFWGPGRIYCRRQLRSAPGLLRSPSAC